MVGRFKIIIRSQRLRCSIRIGAVGSRGSALRTRLVQAAAGLAVVMIFDQKM
jgi:hypothetical protein